jgi:hypothetical protein
MASGISVGNGLWNDTEGLWNGATGLFNGTEGLSGNGGLQLVKGITTDAGVQITTDAGVPITTD